MNKGTTGAGVRRERIDLNLIEEVRRAKRKLATGEGFEVFLYDCHRCANEAYEKLTVEQQEKVRFSLEFQRMFLCPTCGNKRCPKASDHRLDCTGSNEAGQKGSIYE